MKLQRLKLSALLFALVWGLNSARAEDAPVNSELSSALMYQLLIAEISAQNGDSGSAFQLMLDAAQKSRSSELFERAVEIALRARAGDSALQAAQAWTRAQPASRDATRYLLQILIGLNKLPETVEPIQRDLAGLTNQDRIAAITMIPRYFARVNDLKLAVKTVDQALRNELANPTTGAAAHAAAGTMRLLAGDMQAALESAKKGAAIDPKAEEPVQLALVLMDPKLPGAEELVTSHLQATSSAELRMAYARKLIDASRAQDATRQLELLNQTHPDFAEAWLVRGSLALVDKKPEEARKALNTFLQIKQPSPALPAGPTQDRALSQAYLLLADVAEQAKQWDEAERYLDLIDSPQELLRAQIRRASILAKKGNLNGAIELIRSAPDLKPEDARTKVSAEVQLLREYKQYQAAYDLLQKAVKDAPDDVDLLYDLAMAAEKLDLLDEMERLLRQIIAIKPDYHHAYNALGYTLADRGLRLDEARELVRKALEFAPEDPYILDSLGWVEFRSGNLPEALKILQDAYARRQDPEIAAHLGEVLWVMRQQKEALAVWQASLAQNPDNDLLKKTMTRLSQP